MTISIQWKCLEAACCRERWRPLLRANERRFRAGPRLIGFITVLGIAAASPAWAQLPGEEGRLREAGVAVTQEQIVSGAISFPALQNQGLLVFSTQFNAFDGYGDGPSDPANPLGIGGRPTLQNNGTFLRVNGLDGQSCLECHSIVSNASVPPVFGIGGSGGSASNAIGGPSEMDIATGRFNGRFINPPALFGSGGIQLVANEMTEDLQALASQARDEPGTDVPLVTKGVSFGVIRYADGAFDTSKVEGVDSDLVVRAFGRKGEFPTVRAFDVAALAFHFGMQAIELVGVDVDADGDGVANEIDVGEVSALEIFVTTLPRPTDGTGSDRDEGDADGDAVAGRETFADFGCADCHRPQLETRGSMLGYRLPEIPEDPAANVFYEVDLGEIEGGFDRVGDGLSVPLFADLKRHDMGPMLAEDFGSDLDPFFTTARLWGVNDTAPYMHDGRATTLGQAILMHAGEARQARDNYDRAGPEAQADLLSFLRSLNNPRGAPVRKKHGTKRRGRNRDRR